MQTKMNYYRTSIGMAKIWNSDLKFWQEDGTIGTFPITIHLCDGTADSKITSETFGSFL